MQARRPSGRLLVAGETERRARFLCFWHGWNGVPSAAAQGFAVWHIQKEAFASSLSPCELAGSGICARCSVCIFGRKTQRAGAAIPFLRLQNPSGTAYLQDLPKRGISALFRAPVDAAQEVYAQPLGRFLRTLPWAFMISGRAPQGFCGLPHAMGQACLRPFRAIRFVQPNT